MKDICKGKLSEDDLIIYVCAYRVRDISSRPHVYLIYFDFQCYYVFNEITKSVKFTRSSFIHIDFVSQAVKVVVARKCRPQSKDP